jgi:hypothetical protein
MIKLFLTLLTTAAILQSCQKQFNPEEEIPSGRTSSTDSIYVDKVYHIDKNTLDTLQTSTYTYDSRKRVTSLIIVPSDLNTSNIGSYTYYYNGLDTVPYKTIADFGLYYRYPGVYAGREIDTIFHFFDNLGRKLKDSALYYYYSLSGMLALDSTQIRFIDKHTYNFNNTVVTSDYYQSPSDTYAINNSIDSFIVDNFGNILKHYTRDYSSPFTFTYDLVASFTYENQRSPFSYLSNFKTFGLPYFDFDVLMYGERPFYSVPKTITETTVPVGGVTFNNTFNSKNQLVSVDIGHNRVPTTWYDSVRVAITYKSL